jgi:hypothetical protein
MANPSVEKLKQFGMRHGEKLAVGLLVALSLFFVAKGITHPTIATTPDQLKKAAEAADQNLGRPQKDEDILSRLDSEGIKEVGFEKIVDSRISTKQDAAQYAYTNSWVSPEPGAGLLREMPILLAVNTLYAHFGRGGLLVFERDAEGNLVEDKHEGEAKPKRKKKKQTGPGGMGGSSMMGGMQKKKKKKQSAASKLAAEQKKAKKENERLQGKLVGEAKDAEPEKSDEDDLESKDWKETTKGYRWVALTGTFDHKQQRENYAKALKVDYASAAPHYLRLDAERQSLNTDGTWSEWQPVEREESEKILDDAAEEDEELVPEEAMIDALTDYLPFLRSSYYRGVYVAELVPSEKRKVDIPKAPAGGFAGGGGMSMPGGTGMPMPGGMGGGSKAGSAGGMPPGGMMPGGGAFGGGTGMSRGGGGGGMMSSAGGDSGGGRMPGGGMGMAMGMGGASGAGPEDTEFDKTDAPKIMVRMLDFTVKPESTYRYRVRVVVKNPNFGWEMVAVGTDTKEEEVQGPWSEPSGPVIVPADVAAYAAAPSDVPNDPRNNVKFQVVRFHPEDGVTIVKSFDAAPGQMVGDLSSASLPKYTGDKVTSQVKPVDFTAHQVVVASVGGREPLSVLNLSGAPLEDPARALVMRQDGYLVLRDQARDTADGQMSEMKAVYDEMVDTIKGKHKKKRKSQMGGMPGGGSSMGGGYGGMPR